MRFSEKDFAYMLAAHWESHDEIFKERLCLYQMPNTSLNFQLSHTTTMKSFVWLVRTHIEEITFNGTYADVFKGPYY